MASCALAFSLLSWVSCFGEWIVHHIFGSLLAHLHSLNSTFVDGFEVKRWQIFSSGPDIKERLHRKTLDSIYPRIWHWFTGHCRPLLFASLYPCVVILLLKISSFTKFWLCYIYDFWVKITFCKLNIFWMNESIAVILFALSNRAEGLSDSPFFSRTQDLFGPNELPWKYQQIWCWILINRGFWFLIMKFHLPMYIICL